MKLKHVLLKQKKPGQKTNRQLSWTSQYERNSIPWWRLETVSTNVHKNTGGILNIQWHTGDDHPAITTTSTRSSHW